LPLPPLCQLPSFGHTFRKILTMRRQKMQLCALSSSDPGVVHLQQNCKELCTRTVRQVSCVSSEASIATSTVCTPETPKLQQLQAPFARPESLKLQQLCPPSSQASTAASTVCTPRGVVYDLNMDLDGACRGSSEKITDLVCRCSPKASTDGPDAVHLHKDAMHLNKFLVKQLQRQQRMNQLLMRQLKKEQERCHSLEDALLESLRNWHEPAD